MLRICIAGVAGRMGRVLVREAVNKGLEVVGAVEEPSNVNLGSSLRQTGLCNSEVKIMGPSDLGKAVENADVYITFTTPQAEIHNLPIVAGLGKRIVMGTTGFTPEQMKKIQITVSGRVPAVFAPNFSLGVNVLFKLAETLKLLPSEYDISILEVHHTGKTDAPSGTAKKLGEVVSTFRDYSRLIHGRQGQSPRVHGDLEISSLRVGGVPGVHNLVVAGPYEMIRIEHTAFSRSVFAQGALHAAEWVSKQSEPKIYNMDAVLGGSHW